MEIRRPSARVPGVPLPPGNRWGAAAPRRNKQENCYCCCEEKCTLSLLPHFQFPLHGSFETSHAAALSENRASAGYLEERLPRRQPARCHKEPASLGLQREPRPELNLPIVES